MPGSLEREPRGHPLPAPTWTRGPPPNQKPNPRGCQSRLEGEGKPTSSPGKIAPPTPRGSKKALQRGARGTPTRHPQREVLTLDSKSESLTPHDGPCFQHPAMPLRRSRGMAMGTPASACVPPVDSPGPFGPTRLSQPAGIASRALPPFPVASTCHRPAHAALLPAAGRPPASHLLPATHRSHSPIRCLAPTPPTAAADSTAGVGSGAPTRRRRDSVSPSPARRHFGP